MKSAETGDVSILSGSPVQNVNMTIYLQLQIHGRILTAADSQCVWLLQTTIRWWM